VIKEINKYLVDMILINYFRSGTLRAPIKICQLPVTTADSNM
jgi:hypothetical protein